MTSAALQAGGRALEGAHAPHHDEAGGALVSMRPLALRTRQGQAMMRGLARNTEIRAGLTPFIAMGLNPSPTRTMVGHEVREFMLERAIHLTFKRPEPWIEFDAPAGITRVASGAAQAGIPVHLHEVGRAGHAEVEQHLAALAHQFLVGAAGVGLTLFIKIIFPYGLGGRGRLGLGLFLRHRLLDRRQGQRLLRPRSDEVEAQLGKLAGYRGKSHGSSENDAWC